MISEYDVRSEYVGDDVEDEFTFDFRIKALTELLVVESDADGVEVNKVRGDDTSIISSVVFDDGEPGGGTVTFIDPITDGHNLALILAPDETLQDKQFKDKGDFTLKRIEKALDNLGKAIQRLQYLAKRTPKIGETMLDAAIDLFNFDLPIPEAGQIPVVNDDGDGMEWLDPSDVSDRSEDRVELNNNELAAVDVDGLLFSSDYEAFELLMHVRVDATADLNRTYKFVGCKGAAGWVMSSVVAVGDVTNIVFTITLAGQVQYTSPNEAGFVSSNLSWKILSLRAA